MRTSQAPGANDRDLMHDGIGREERNVGRGPARIPASRPSYQRGA
ncbi:MAG: hypothetical protein QOJ75_1556, partial [Chloroflexota bacterium]|nr:hypothetical protein [Chloroflexota bacterium]